MKRLTFLLVLLLGLGAAPAPAAAAVTPIQIFGAWHCSDDFCTWSAVRSVAQFDSQNHWLVDRGDGRPSVNLVVLSFVNPLRLLNQANDAGTVNGVPRGMTADIVNYFTSRGIRVMFSIGGATYVDDWDTALSTNATLLGQRAAAMASQFGVGVEIDYEKSTGPNLAGLQAFISAYRAVHPYSASGANPSARLTIDLAAGDRYLIDLTRKATADWLQTGTPVLDYANAMVPARQPSASAAQGNWQEHVDGKPNYGPPILPLAPAKFTGGLYVAYGRSALPECTNFNSSVQKTTAPFVQSVAPKGAGTTAGMLGFMFWAAERPATRGIGTVPPNTCEGGMGAAATAFSIPVPMPGLRQS